ncbi:hypothetical protein NV379_19655 [Paenibacillus sp. N1-5-1-14]|uniref:hypothetical protein n=1 Tax=Paenibacillus radicibacter TaxID=2972488 RepID=UPI0021597B78|nr:hypothetical protein [Paenibacillus radicibacter]MCR8644873.1 hypothetical protein [Paenibacillus radicibacter]
MRYIIKLIFLIFFTLLLGCTPNNVKQSEHEIEPNIIGVPITENERIVLLPFQEKLSILNTKNLEVSKNILLGKTAIDYAIAPNGKIYIPLLNSPGDKSSYIAVLNAKTGEMSTIQSPYNNLGSISITNDGIAFVQTGFSRGGNTLELLIIDTVKDQVSGTVSMPGPHESLTLLNKNQILASIAVGDSKGVYSIDSQIRNAELLIDMKNKPQGPSYMMVDKRNNDIVYFLFNGVSTTETKTREELLKRYEMKDLDPHLMIWNLKEKKQIKQINFKQNFPKNMAIDDNGNIYIGHSSDTSVFTVIDINKNSVREVNSVYKPLSVFIENNKLFVGGFGTHEMDIFQLPDLEKIQTISFDGKILIPSH